MKSAKKNTFLKEFIDTSFGFEVVLHNVEMAYSEKHGSYPIGIDYRKEGRRILQELIVSNQRFTGAKLKFARQTLKQSLREIAFFFGVAHSTVREWEQAEGQTGMTFKQEMDFRFHCSKILARMIEDEIESKIRNCNLGEEREKKAS